MLNGSSEGESPNRQKIEKTSGQLFSCLLQNDLTEAEVVSSITMALAMRVAYDSNSLEELISKIDKAQELFGNYARANLSTAMSVIIARQESEKGALN